MKKHLIAAAVAGAFAVPAMAQVSLSGVIDVGVFNDSVDGQRSTQIISSSVRSTSQITFSGREDLGGGLRAGFTLQSSLAADTGRLGASSIGDQTASSAQFFDRLAFVSLSGGFGEVQLGKTSNALDARSSAASNGFNINNDRLDNDGKLNNSVRYLSPRFSGIQLDLAKVQGENRTSGNRGEGDQTILGISFVQGPIAAGIGQSSIKGATSAADIKRSVLDFAYDFGAARVAVARNESERDTKTAGDARVDSITVSVPLGSFRVVVGHHSGKDLVTTANTSKWNTLGVDYSLSKRTTGYLAWSDTKRKGSSSLRGNANTAIGSTTTNDSSTLFGVGIAHTF